MIDTFIAKRALQLTKEGDKVLNEASSDEAIKESDLLYELATQLYNYAS